MLTAASAAQAYAIGFHRETPAVSATDGPTRTSVKRHHLAARVQGSGCRLQQPDEAPPGFSIRDRLAAVLHALDEMLDFLVQRFGHRELRRPHVAGTVSNPHLVDVVGVRIERDAPVVD